MAFVVETKEKNPSITEVQSQIQNTIDVLEPILRKYSNNIILIPTLFAKSLSSINYRILLSIKVKYRGKKLNISFLKNGSNIINILRI